MSIRKVGIREARQRLRLLLDQAQAGDEIIVLRRGIEVGRLVGPGPKSISLPDLTELRKSVKRRGHALSEDIREARRSNRY